MDSSSSSSLSSIPLQQPPLQQRRKVSFSSNSNPIDSSNNSRPLYSVSDAVNFITSDPNYTFLGTCRNVNAFEKLNIVGEGTYGIVYRARDRGVISWGNEDGASSSNSNNNNTTAITGTAGRMVALKRIRMEDERDGFPLASLREISLLKRLDHQNIVKVLDVVVGNSLDHVYMAMEYCEHDMASLMDNNPQHAWSTSDVKCLMTQLLQGIEYLHDNYVIHRDLKLSNLLLTKSGILKIADFGLARKFQYPFKPMSPRVVTLWYRSPELLFGAKTYSTAVDMWAAGCIFGEFLRNTPLLPGPTEAEQIRLIVNLLGRPSRERWPGYDKLPLANTFKLPDETHSNIKNVFSNVTSDTHHLLKRFLTYDPEQRISVKKALEHPYFKEHPRAKDPALLPTFPEHRNMPKEQEKLRKLVEKRQQKHQEQRQKQREQRSHQHHHHHKSSHHRHSQHSSSTTGHRRKRDEGTDDLNLLDLGVPAHKQFKLT